jgi:hypothetical protein
MEKLPAGAVRKDIYKAIEFIAGRQLTEVEHKQFKALMTHYAMEYGLDIAQKTTPTEAKEHTYICGVCGGTERFIGKKFKMMLKTKYLDPEKLTDTDRQRVEAIHAWMHKTA